MRPDGEIPFRWQRSAHCQSNNGCVEVALLEKPAGPEIAIRDGAAPEDETFLTLTRTTWRALLTEVKSENLTPSSTPR